MLERVFHKTRGDGITALKLLGCFLFLVVLVVLVCWLLIHMVGLPVAAGVLLLGIIAVRFALSRAGKAVKNFTEDIIPKQKTLKLAAGERFEGMAFAWTFPIACEVQQTVIDDLETLLVKPAFELWDGAPEMALTAATMSTQEMKEGTEDKLEEALTAVPDLQSDGYVPVQVGPYSGEGKFFDASSESGPVKGEFIYLGDENFSIAWNLVVLADKFQPLADQFRQLASLIERKEPAEAEDTQPS